MTSNSHPATSQPATSQHGPESLAESLLREAVFRARAKQAAARAPLAGDLLAEIGPGSCGLGAKALVEEELSPAGRAAFEALFDDRDDEALCASLHAALAAWVERQDAFDRRRNHYLRDFRRAHGFDRRAYAPEVEAAYRAGLDGLNAEEDAARRAAAADVLALGGQAVPGR